MEKIKLGISSCLLGEKVRYDAGHKLEPFLKYTFGKYVHWVPVCPEVESGLTVPRAAMRLVERPDGHHLVERLTGINHTQRMDTWIKNKLQLLEKEELCGFVFKSRSPSSGIRGVKIYNPSGIPVGTGPGKFGDAFMKRFPDLPVEDEVRLQDPALRENFIERVFVFRRWRELIQTDGKAGDLVSFHTDHKLLIMSHSIRHYGLLGKMVAEAKEFRPDPLRNGYLRILMEGLKLIATAKKNTNVLMHIVGYFKKELDSAEKVELLEIVRQYYSGFIPLIVPVTLINHYVRKYDKSYLNRQYYLRAHPIELMLRNHS